ncbi:MAG: allantoinase AllB, partial [Gemmatimonadaceae bacterium]|nr:allantoinase AllB [Gemmatimonadaceae bacterium]
MTPHSHDTSNSLVVRGLRVVTQRGTIAASLCIRNGVIVRIGGYDEPMGAEVAVDARSSLIMPGLVDTHVHMNEPGRTDWEGFETGTRAAAAGGITTLLDMPLNSTPATTNRKALLSKRQAALGKCSVDVGFIGGVVPGNANHIRALWEGGVFSFKCFLVHSGVDDFPNVAESDLRAVMPVLSELGATLMVHAELPGPIETATDGRFEATAEVTTDPVIRGKRPYDTYLRTRPRAAEQAAIDLAIRLCREFRTRVHIVHLSSADALLSLSRARAEGLPITVETCPHYLTFAAEEIPDGATQFKCAPPIRERENRERLWHGLGEGIIDMIASDHSPCPPAMKQLDSGDFARAWGGIASLQLGLSVMWTAARERGFPVERIAEWMSHAPARVAGLSRHAGTIQLGQEANLVIWNPDAEFRVNPATLHHRHSVTPYAAMPLH